MTHITYDQLAAHLEGLRGWGFNLTSNEIDKVLQAHLVKYGEEKTVTHWVVKFLNAWSDEKTVVIKASDSITARAEFHRCHGMRRKVLDVKLYS